MTTNSSAAGQNQQNQPQITTQGQAQMLPQEQEQAQPSSQGQGSFQQPQPHVPLYQHPYLEQVPTNSMVSSSNASSSMAITNNSALAPKKKLGKLPIIIAAAGIVVVGVIITIAMLGAGKNASSDNDELTLSRLTNSYISYIMTGEADQSFSEALLAPIDESYAYDVYYDTDNIFSQEDQLAYFKQAEELLNNLVDRSYINEQEFAEVRPDNPQYEIQMRTKRNQEQLDTVLDIIAAKPRTTSGIIAYLLSENISLEQAQAEITTSLEALMESANPELEEYANSQKLLFDVSSQIFTIYYSNNCVTAEHLIGNCLTSSKQQEANDLMTQAEEQEEIASEVANLAISKYISTVKDLYFITNQEEA